jgi:hypothetical protein
VHILGKPVKRSKVDLWLVLVKINVSSLLPFKGIDA